jgi:hypothetical protein
VIRGVALVVSGAVIGAVITWGLVHPRPGESFPAVFRGTTQGVTSDGDGVAFYPNERYADVFDAFPAFEVSGDNRTSAVSGGICLAPGTAEQDVVFAVSDMQLVWYACLTEGTVRT